MGQRPGLVFAVVAVALATDVAQEYIELARRRLSKVGVVFLEDDDAVNIQSRCGVCITYAIDAAASPCLRRLDGVDDALLVTPSTREGANSGSMSAQVHRRNTQIQSLPPDLGLPGAAR